MADRRYSREEVDAILGRAIERERSIDGLSHEELLGVAGEVGVSRESLEKAAAEVAGEKQQQSDLLQVRRDAMRGFIAHLIPYLFVNALLILINLATTRFPWALFPIFGWGIGIFSHLLAVLSPSRERLDRRLARERERRRRRELKRAIKSNAKEFEAAVGEGVAALLKVAASKVNEGAEAVNRRPGQTLRVEPVGKESVVFDETPMGDDTTEITRVHGRRR